VHFACRICKSETHSNLTYGQSYNGKLCISSITGSAQIESLHAWLEASAANQMKTALFCVITQRVLVIPYRLFRDDLSLPNSWPFNRGPIGFPETSVINCHYMLRNSPEERSSHIAYPPQLEVLKIGSIDCPETSVMNYHYTLPNKPGKSSSRV